jgi:hypothetical protein
MMLGYNRSKHDHLWLISEICDFQEKRVMDFSRAQALRCQALDEVRIVSLVKAVSVLCLYEFRHVGVQSGMLDVLHFMDSLHLAVHAR